MSTAAAADAPAPAKGKKKRIIIIAAAVLVLGGGGGAAALMMKKKNADTEEGDHAPAKSASSHDPGVPPTFVPLDPFTVNLADRDADRYAQIGITLQIADPHVSEQIKLYMPAIRNNILLAIADSSAADLLGRDGKSKLAKKVMNETARALGHEVPDEEADAEDEEAPSAASKKKKKKKKAAEPELPVTAVHFSNFIIQ
jgi:flagellar protein FliL